MNFNQHFQLAGRHAPFSPSNSSWLRYDDEKIVTVYRNSKAKEYGTRLHEWAAETIKLGIKQPRSNKTLYAYVNDAIGFKMDVEVVLYYSDYFFGTADAISFRNNVLRIHDLKTGMTPAGYEQLLVYAALFCLEYRKNPYEIDKVELRIYQNDIPPEPCVPEPEAIKEVMDKIVRHNSLLEKVDYEEG